MNQQLQITRATVADTESLAQFSRKAFVDAYEKNNRPDYVQQYADTSFSKSAIRADLENPEIVYQMAVLGKNILGYVKLCCHTPTEGVADPDAMQLSRIYVDESKQGLGVGGKLLDAAVTEARDSGHSTIWLAAWEENTRAHRFYERHGYRIVGRTHFMLGPERQEDVVMARAID